MGVAEAEEEIHDDLTGCGVEVSGGFVGEEEAGAGGEGAGEGDALLLAAAELAGEVGEAVAEAYGFERLGGAVGGVAGAGQLHGNADVFQGCHGGDEMEGLEHDAHGAAAEPGQGVFVETGDVLAGDVDLAAGDGFEAGEDHEEAGFAGAAGADDADGFALGDFEVDA